MVFDYAENGDLHNNLSKKLLGGIKLVHFGIFQWGKFRFIIKFIVFLINKYLVK